jgi:disulfide bond formation protein DsbB
VTLATANSLSTPGARNPALTAASAVALIAAATLAGAWFFQLVLEILPCPLCLEQRYAYYLAIPLAVIVAAGALAGWPRKLLVAGLVVIAIAFVINAGLGVYHSGVEWKWWAGPTACGGTLGDLGSAGDLLSRVETTRVIRCDEAAWRFLGLSLAGYNVLISLGLAAIAALGVRKALAK